MSSRITMEHINILISYLLRSGLTIDQQYAFQRSTRFTEITFPNAGDVTYALRNVSYADVYERFNQNRVFNLKLIDGALIQLTYLFDGSALLKHRLAFLPAPQGPFDPSEQLAVAGDFLRAEINGRRIVPVPMRFDFNVDDVKHHPIDHPKSHLTLGEYVYCRIPVSAPMTPHGFMKFILKHFYKTTNVDLSATMPALAGEFEPTITPAELDTVHMVVA